MTIFYKEDNMELLEINSIQEASPAYLIFMVEIMTKKVYKVYSNKTSEQLWLVSHKAWVVDKDKIRYLE